MQTLGYTVEYRDEQGNVATHSLGNVRDAIRLFEQIAGEDVTGYGFPMPEQWETLGWETHNIEQRGYVFTRYSEEVGNWSAIISVSIRHEISDEDVAHVVNLASDRYGVAPETVQVTEVTEFPGEGVTVTVAYGDYACGTFGCATYGVTATDISIYLD